MKQTFRLMAINALVILSFSSFAKYQPGVYKTASDFANNKITYSVDCKIHPNNSVVNLPYITVIDNGKKHKLEKNRIYGYVDCNNKAYRFYEGAEFQIAEAGGVIIYSQPEHIEQSKGYKVVNKYYFSAKADGKILPLTLNNLKDAYRDNEKFINLLGQYFSGSDIAEYDKIHKTYKVNYVFNKTGTSGN